MPYSLKDYPINWRDEIRPSILKRDGYKCTGCGAHQRQKYYTHKGVSMLLTDEFQVAWAEKQGHKIKTIFLSISHQNHVVSDCSPENLKTRCQKCHLAYDFEFHKAMRIAGKKR